MGKNLKRTLSSSYYDGNSFSSSTSQKTLTDTPTESTEEQNLSRYQSHEDTIEHATPTTPPLSTSTMEAPLPFKASLWRANTTKARSNHMLDLERVASSKSSNFLEKRVSNMSRGYHTELTRDNSIATAISMRRADIMVSRDNPQNLHQHRMSGVRNEDQETATITNIENGEPHMSIHAIQEEDELLFEKKKSVIILLGRLLIKCGCPCHRVDDTLQQTSRILTVDASFSFLPDSVLITFTNGEDSQSIMVKSPQGYDNGKIGRINDIMNLFFKGDMDLDRCLVLLHDVATAPPTCGVKSTILFFVMSSFTTSAMMFGGTWIDALISALLGFIVALLFLVSSQFPIYAKVFEITASISVAFLARALHKYCCFLSVVLPGLLILLPGYTMTVGVIELSARHVTTGIVRLVYSVFYAFQLGYGLQIGSSAYFAIDSNAPEEGLCNQPHVSPWFYILLLPFLSIAVSLSYGSDKKQWISQVLSSSIAFCLSYFLGKVIPDNQVVSTIAAFAIGIYSNFALKITGESPLVPLSVATTLLVPGSLGVRGAYSVLYQNNLAQINFPMQMLTIALGLAAGLFASSMVVYPSGKKRSMYISL